MCGIAGVWGRTLPEEALDAATSALVHRGPDGQGRRRSAADAATPWNLVHTRLAINDLSAGGDQPMSDPTGRYHMVFNGEIYNHPELVEHCRRLGRVPRSRMDGEVILHLYAEYGSSCFAMLNGIFAVAVVDAVADVVVLARDPLGVKPLYYRLPTADAAGLAFASEPAALAALGVDLGRPSLVGLAMFLTFLWVPAPETPFEGVRSLEPGELLVHDGGASTLRRFCPRLVPDGDHEDADPDATASEFGPLFDRACERQLLADVPLGAMASGGIDSGLVLASVGARLQRAYTIVWGDEEHAEAGLRAERERTRAVAAHSGTALRELLGTRLDLRGLPPTGDLFSDPSASLTRAIAAEARADGLKVLFSGLGGDELLGGYRRHTAARVIELARGPAPAVLRWASRLRPPGREGRRTEYLRRMARAVARGDRFSGYMSLCSYSDGRRRAEVLGCDEVEVADEVVWARHRAVFDLVPDSVSLVRRAMALDLALYLPGQGLAYADRAAMAEGVEVRVPWLDLDLVRWSLEQPTSSLVTLRNGKIPARRRADEVFGSAIGQAPKMSFGAPRTVVPGGAAARTTRQDDYLGSAAALLRAHTARFSPGERTPVPTTGRRES